MDEFQPPEWDREPHAPSLWPTPFLWLAFAVVAFVAFELTAEPAVSVVVMCCKFGWNDVLTAFWLRRNDPWRGRGRACFWFCLASAATKVVLTAFVLIMLVVYILHAALGPRPGNGAADAPATFIAASVVLMSGMPLVTLFGVIGCLSARKHGVRVWIDASLHSARRDGRWPPEVTGQQNFANPTRLMMMGGLSLGIPCIAVPLAGLLIWALAFAFWPAPGVGGRTAMLCAGAVLVVVADGIGLWMIARHTRGVVANHPAECWNAQEASPQRGSFP
ncbi:MAG: hypothetical protein EXS05_09895 [Planctomycetaceae bacterium]|nr:hypothetical protein [Planctomycetaceae bacterium]